MKNNGEKIQLHERLAKLETKVEEIKYSIDQIRTNHLPHIENRLQKLEGFRVQFLIYGSIMMFTINIIVQYLLGRI